MKTTNHKTFVWSAIFFLIGICLLIFDPFWQLIQWEIARQINNGMEILNWEPNRYLLLLRFLKEHQFFLVYEFIGLGLAWLGFAFGRIAESRKSTQIKYVCDLKEGALITMEALSSYIGGDKKTHYDVAASVNHEKKTSSSTVVTWDTFHFFNFVETDFISAQPEARSIYRVKGGKLEKF